MASGRKIRLREHLSKMLDDSTDKMNQLSMGNRKSYNHSSISSQRSPYNQKFGKATDRFKMKRDQVEFPSSVDYNTSVPSIGADTSVVRRNFRASIGKQTVDVLDDRFHKRERSQVPGPGQYKAFSDFG